MLVAVHRGRRRILLLDDHRAVGRDAAPPAAQPRHRLGRVVDAHRRMRAVILAVHVRPGVAHVLVDAPAQPAVRVQVRAVARHVVRIVAVEIAQHPLLDRGRFAGRDRPGGGSRSASGTGCACGHGSMCAISAVASRAANAPRVASTPSRAAPARIASAINVARIGTPPLSTTRRSKKALARLRRAAARLLGCAMPFPARWCYDRGMAMPTAVHASVEMRSTLDEIRSAFHTCRTGEARSETAAANCYFGKRTRVLPERSTSSTRAKLRPTKSMLGFVTPNHMRSFLKWCQRWYFLIQRPNGVLRHERDVRDVVHPLVVQQPEHGAEQQRARSC